MAFEKINIPSAKECFFEEIKSKILLGELRPGEKLPSERGLAGQTGVNQSAVHLAIKELERAGFVEIIPRHGTYVADFAEKGNYDTLHEILRTGGRHLTRERIVSLVETRNAIEGGALIRLAKNHTHEDIVRMREYIATFKMMRGKNLSAAELGRMTKGFHYLICRLSGNEVFILLMNSFADISQSLWAYCAGYWGIDELIAQSEHITELIEQGRGLEAQVYITDKFDQYVCECGISGAEA